MAAALKETYKSEIAPALMKKFEYKSVMQIPKLDKVVINVGCGEARENSKVVDAIIRDLQIITGQRPVICRAKKSVALNSVRVCQSVLRLHFAATECMNSLRDFSILHFQEFVTSEVLTLTHLTVVATMLWVLKSS